jgi:hypothetical protein
MRWCVLMRWDDSGRWYRASARFSTQEEAEEYGWNEWNRHPTMKEYRVEQAPEE